MARLPSALWRDLRVYQIFGANTDVGKTIFSTLLCRVANRGRLQGRVSYLKPVSTGSLDEADNVHLQRYAPDTHSETLYQFNEPISPHLAARAARREVPDNAILQAITKKLQTSADIGPGLMLVETAGGPHSPGPSGTLQAELYRPLRMPVIFIADWHLGGISTSITAFESLKIRGYDVEGVAVLEDGYYKNHEYLKPFFADHEIPFLSVPQPPARYSKDDYAAMERYYKERETSSDPSTSVVNFLDTISSNHEARISRLDSIASDSFKKIWWPFTQHQQLSPKSLTIIDSAYGDYFQTLTPSPPNSAASIEADPTHQGPSMLQPTLDGSASWWTQGLGHANPTLTLAAAYAAGRYGHVMFAEAINEPALAVASNLLATVKNPRLSRCFYSDNGSTGMEVAMKMALTGACQRYGWGIRDQEIEILGLQGSYHGDTMGNMDMSEPSVYNDKIHWYKSRGFWFEAPTVKMRDGKWIIEKPTSLDGKLGESTSFGNLQQIFDQSRDVTDDAATYERYITSTLERLTQGEKRRFGALVMEPVVLGAGGMLLVDPLFQRTLANVVRRSSRLFSPDSPELQSDLSSKEWTGLPIIADEVFTGLYRLGHASSSHLLHIDPDIAVHAKLLTGGLVPLSCTLASENIFEAFLAEGKSDALLHGHSYTAHPVGCMVADASLKMLNKLAGGGSWDGFRQDWGVQSKTPKTDADQTKHAAASVTPPQVWSVWSNTFVTSLSQATHRVDSVWALGSVLSIALKDEQGGGYTSNAAKSLQKQLFIGDGRGWNIHSRVLGNVLYLMTSQTSKIEDVREWERLVSESVGL